MPSTPSTVAVIRTGPPTDWPVTTPVEATEATPGDPLVQVTGRPVRTLPSSSRGVAVRVTVSLTAIVAAPGNTSTVAT